MATVSDPSVFPDHVPQELRWDHSFAQFAHVGDDPFLAVSRLYDGPDIFFARDAIQQRPGWVITRNALQNEVFVDYEHFTSEGQTGLDKLLGVDLKLAPLEYDPPVHSDFRRVINPFFMPKAVNSMSGPVRETCDRLIAKFEDRGGCEFIEEFAVPFPSYVFLSLVGMPEEEAPQFLAWEHGMLRGETLEDRLEAHRGVLNYLQGFVREQRQKPSTELLDAVLKSEIDGHPITDNEVLGLLYTFYLGGLDTVYSTLGWMMRHLAMHQDLQCTLRDNPDILPHAVDEMGRAFSISTNTRMVAKDHVFHGVEMRRGDLVLLPLYLAGRDPEAWDNPNEIDLTRRPSALTFASGPHLCAGRHLARRELRIALESFLTRFKNIHIDPGKPYSFHTSSVYGIDELHLAWDRIGGR